MGQLKAVKLGDSRPGAYIELPVGVHTIGDRKYTVVDIQEVGYDNKPYTRRVIDFIEPVKPETPAAE